MSWKITSTFSRYFSYSVPTDQQSQEQATNKVYHKWTIIQLQHIFYYYY